jgi:hypothetical protein
VTTPLNLDRMGDGAGNPAMTVGYARHDAPGNNVEQFRIGSAPNHPTTAPTLTRLPITVVV